MGFTPLRLTGAEILRKDGNDQREANYLNFYSFRLFKKSLYDFFEITDNEVIFSRQWEAELEKSFLIEAEKLKNHQIYILSLTTQKPDDLKNPLISEYCKIENTPSNYEEILKRTLHYNLYSDIESYDGTDITSMYIEQRENAMFTEVRFFSRVAYKGDKYLIPILKKFFYDDKNIGRAKQISINLIYFLKILSFVCKDRKFASEQEYRVVTIVNKNKRIELMNRLKKNLNLFDYYFKIHKNIFKNDHQMTRQGLEQATAKLEKANKLFLDKMIAQDFSNDQMRREKEHYNLTSNKIDVCAIRKGLKQCILEHEYDNYFYIPVREARQILGLNIDISTAS